MDRDISDEAGAAARDPGTFECYITYACNQRCAFCFTPGELRRGGTVPFRELARSMMLMRRGGRRMLALLGGEPTVHPDIERIVALGKALGYGQICTFSNGARYADRAFTARMRKAGLTAVNLSVHGHTADLHDGVTGVPGSFGKVLAAIANLRACGISPVLICVLQRRNYRGLRAYVSFFRGLGIRRFMLFFMKHQGRVVEQPGRARDLLLPLGEAAAAVRDVFDYFRDEAVMPPLLEHFPPCALPGYEGRMVDYDSDAAEAARACLHPGEGTEPILDRAYKGRVYLPGCSSCLFRRGCHGIDPNYLAVLGPAGLKPVSRRPRPFHARWGRAAKAALSEEFWGG